MSFEALKQELAALPPQERRRVQAFLVALEGSGDPAHRRKLAAKIDKKAEDFATLKGMDRRLGTSPGDKP
ncbi:hypothetical protein SBV1_130010 [Verrucomicrobia bacterium]|nr:hypothetical protein SBV1_130010 [Verrucomicrobiota bacterium]